MSGIFVSTVDDLMKALEGKLDQDVEVKIVGGAPLYCSFCERSSPQEKFVQAARISRIYTRGGHMVIEVEPK